MLVLERARLVFLANPKTATQSIRAMLKPHAAVMPADLANRHVNARAYDRRWKEAVVSHLGFAPETFAVMREPVAHLGSWYRYRQRPALEGHENSTKGLSFAEFIAAVLQPEKPAYASIGQQDKFLGAGKPHQVDLIFDYAQMPMLLAFLSERVGAPLTLPRRNVSPKEQTGSLELPEDLRARLRLAYAGEFDLYDRVRAAGVLRRTA